MTHSELILYILTIGFEVLLCALVFARRLHRRLPFFAALCVLLLAGTLGLQFAYRHFGFRSAQSYDAYWLTAALIMVARGFAVAELCRVALRFYFGIWSLAWRILAVLGLLLMANAAVDASGQLDRVAIYGLTIERDFAVSCVVLLLAIITIRHYYRLRAEGIQVWITTGMLLVCLVDLINNTILRSALVGHLEFWLSQDHASVWGILRSQVDRANQWWNIARLSAFWLSIAVWCAALWKPLPEPAEKPVLLPANVYGELTPAIHVRLQAFNDRLVEILH
jgi:hypothetical protein